MKFAKNSIRDIVMHTNKPVYIRTETAAQALQLLLQAEAEGFRFGDGKKPTEKEPDDILAFHKDMTVNYVGFVGRIAWQGDYDTVLRVHFQDLL